MKKIRILQVGKFYPPHKGGMETFLQCICNCFSTPPFSESFITEVLVFNDCNESRKEIVDNVEVFRAGRCFSVRSLPISISYIIAFLKFAKRADIIHIHLPNPLAAFIALMLHRKTRIVLHWHSDIVQQKFLKLLYLPFERILLSKTESIIATSEAYLQSSKQLMGHRKRVTIVPLAIPASSLDREGGSQFELDEYSSRRVVLSIGRLVEYKGFESLIEAAQFLPDDVMVLICGEGPLRQRLENKIAGLSDPRKVKLLGEISEKEKAHLLEKCAVFCLPSITKNEAFGVVILEAFRAGKAVVATKIRGSGTSWVNQDSVTGINVNCEASQELASALVKVLSDGKLRLEMEKRAFARFQELFQIERVCEKIATIYRKQIECSSARTKIASDDRKRSHHDEVK